MLRSIFVKCAAVSALTTVVVAAVLAIQSERLNSELARKGVIALAGKTVELNTGLLVQPLRFGAVPKIEEVVAQALAASGQDGVGALVLDRDGALVSSGGDVEGIGLQALARAALDSGDTALAQDGLHIARPVTLEDGTPLGVFALALTDAAAQAALSGDRMQIRAVALGVMLAMMVATAALLRRLLQRPMAGLGESIARISNGDYESRIPMQDRRDEVGMIAAHLADLTAALRKGREAEQLRAEQHAAQADVVRHLSEGLDALADGVLTHTLSREFPEDYETLRRNYNRAVGSLQQAIAAVQSGAESIRNGADEIGKASDDLSRRTETQAATLEQSAAALDQLLSIVKSAAEGAREVDVSVQNASNIAQQNGAVMQQAVDAMTAIEESSERIGEIISVIDDIAFQTNLLALNAGVEAARAGASGKGFAVVATEVRALAQRSSDAAQQIKGLIGNSTQQIKDGAYLVQRAGDALTEVVGMVGEISDHVSRIAQGASEQADGLREINVGVTNLDRVTQQNAAMVEQATAAAQMLRNDAGSLTQLVARFTIEGTSPRSGGSGGYDDFSPVDAPRRSTAA